MDPGNDCARATSAPIRVIIADGHRIVLVAVRTLLRTSADIRVVGEADDGLVALQLIERLAPDVAVLDLDMPRLHGLALTKGVVARSLATRVLLLSVSPDAGIQLCALEAGAAGCLAKGAADQELAVAIRAVAAGRIYVRTGGGEYADRLWRSSTPVRLAGRDRHDDDFR